MIVSLCLYFNFLPVHNTAKIVLLAAALAGTAACQLSRPQPETTAAKKTTPAAPAAAAAPAAPADALTEAPPARLPYPKTKQIEQTDSYHGTQVEDPYRWLEDLNSAETEAWVKAQNNVTFDYLSKIPYREQVRERLEQIWNYPKYSAPFRKGGQYFFYKNDGLQNQSVLYVQKGLNAQPEVFLDPNKLSADGTTSISTLSFSHDDKYAVYGTSGGGSDWNDFYVMDVNKRQLLPDHLEWIKFSGAAWYKDGFYYSRYDAPTDGNKLAKRNEFHKVYFHKLGTPQSADKLVHQNKEKALRNFSAQTTDDERFLIIFGTEGSSSSNIFSVQDLSKPGSKLKPVVEKFEYQYSVVDNLADKLLVRTSRNAPNYQLVLLDPANPDPKNWKTVIPESKDLLQGVSRVGDRLFATYLKDAASQVRMFDLQGKPMGEVPLPGIGNVSGFSGDKTDKETFFVFTSFTYPPTVYRYDLTTNTASVFRKSEAKVEAGQFETKQVFYTSKDGTKVPMFIVHKKGLKLNGNNPTYLYAYGGFNIPATPVFSPATLFWLENGGVYAQPSLRGGGEYGEAWHKGGMLEKKQNVFDDFIAAAEYLQREGYTSKEKLCISGRSNGGLLVGATMTQRPELFRVALPAVGVMDMLRYHKFTIGWAWAPEFGSSDSSRHFSTLRGYSPLHNIRQGVLYPSTLVTTADHDDRVVPSHSFKFISTLQEKGDPKNPYLIRVDVKAGHGAGKPTSLQIQEWADVWSFVYHEMGVNPFAEAK